MTSIYIGIETHDESTLTLLTRITELFIDKKSKRFFVSESHFQNIETLKLKATWIVLTQNSMVNMKQ